MAIPSPVATSGLVVYRYNCPAPPEHSTVAFPFTNKRFPLGCCTIAPQHSPSTVTRSMTKWSSHTSISGFSTAFSDKARTISKPVASPLACRIRRWLCAPSFVRASSPFSRSNWVPIRIKLRTPLGPSCTSTSTASSEHKPAPATSVSCL
ncbi:hypothetical protein D3C80_1194380 [compost metagenome]